MGYLICKKCGGYYKLQPGEYPENFDKCNCGGELEYSKDSNYISEREEYWIISWLRKHQLILFIIASAFPILAIYLQIIHQTVNLSIIIIIIIIVILFYQYRISSEIQKRNIFKQHKKDLQDENHDESMQKMIHGLLNLNLGF